MAKYSDVYGDGDRQGEDVASIQERASEALGGIKSTIQETADDIAAKAATAAEAISKTAKAA